MGFIRPRVMAIVCKKIGPICFGIPLGGVITKFIFVVIARLAELYDEQEIANSAGLLTGLTNEPGDDGNINW
jgi:hypothetical protein